MVLTDILKRWQLLRGNKAILCTGTDEHGMKIQQAAAKARCEPGEFCDKGAETFKMLAAKASLSYDHFIRTTDLDHREAVQHFWHELRERGYIYTSKHEGWYCVSDETFYPESAIEKRVDPITGRTHMASQETGKEVEWTSESNYHFRLSAFKDRLLEFYKNNPDFVVPATRMKDVVRWVSEGLEDLSVSRPSDRLTWGIPVPGDEKQTIYVWLDALVNYITKAGYPWAPGLESAGGWPADVHVIGKDIVRFHCIYWPAFLLALDIPLPKQILTHAHWTLGHQKMAKSTGNVVNPFFALDRFGVDPMRYYLAHDGGISDDADYSNHHIIHRYKKDLQGGLGNLVSRLTRPKAWSVRNAVRRAREKTLPAPDRATLVQRNNVEDLRNRVTASFDKLNPGAALREITSAIYEVNELGSFVLTSSQSCLHILQTNRYVQHGEPWALMKTGREDDADKALNIVFHATEATRIIGILLQPYMPHSAAQLLDMLGVAPNKRAYFDAVWLSDMDYGEAKAPVGKCAYDGLFPPLAVET